MANFFGEVYGQIGSVWKKLTVGQKLIIVLVTTAVTMGIVGVIYWSSRLEMGTLFGNLSAKTVGDIQARLEEEGVPYELKDGGGTIMVPKDRIYELRNKLMQQGLIQEEQGMEIFDDLQLGMTEFLQNVNLTRALEGELSRTITWLTQVAAAKVHINRPKPTIFTELERPPTASVTLKLVPGRMLSQREVLGIANIVASAVEGLDPVNVTIVDNRGRMLSRTASEYEDDMGSGQFEVKQAFEGAMTRKVQQQLDGVVGQNKVRVVVNVDLDHQRQTRREEKYSIPEEGKVVMKERINTTLSTKTGFSQGGATGTQAKVAGQPGAAVKPSTPDKDESEDSETEYAVNKTDLDVINMGATIKRLSLAIMIDKTLEDRSADIEEIVKQAVGYDETRGDSSTTAVIEFTQPDVSGVEEELGSYEQKEFILTVVKYGIQGLSVAGVLFVLFKMLKRSEKRASPHADRRDRGFMPMTLSDNVSEDSKRIREEVMAAVQADPIMATDILHEWLKEE